LDSRDSYLAAYLKVDELDMRTQPLYFLYGGGADADSVANAGGRGYYWSSTGTSSTFAYNLGFYPATIVPSRNSYRHAGTSIRCLAR